MSASYVMRVNRWTVSRALAFLLTVSLLVPVACSAQREDTSDARRMADQFSQLFESAAKKVSPSVVPIFAEQAVSGTAAGFAPGSDLQRFFGDDFFRRFFGEVPHGQQLQRKVRSMGSGVIVSEDGYILTNNHVVRGADKLTVVLEDGSKHPAKIIGTDPATDVAVVKIDAKGLPTVEIGDSDNVRVGQWVIAVGNPFQLLHSVTAGIISAKGRSSIGLADYEDFIQTDASINPGNSGGALADLDGNVVGINTAISSPSGANAGVGFAIPINMARSVMDQLIKSGSVSRGFLGLLPQDIDENLASAMKLKDNKGALVGDVNSDGPADKAGIKRGDVIVKFDDQPVDNSTELRNQVAAAEPGKKVPITVIRDGKEKTLNVVPGERPRSADTRAPEMGGSGGTDLSEYGFDAQDLTPNVAKQLGYEDLQGVLVTGVADGTPAADAHLARGDLIEQANRQDVHSVDDLRAILSKSKEGDTVLLLVRRGQSTFFAAMRTP